MVGQTNNLHIIDTWKEFNLFPSFIIISGEKGSGKKTLAAHIAKRMGGCVVTPGIGVDAVREAIDNAYKCNASTVSIFPDADKMSPQAKNALLKVTEEAPKRAYFIMTIEAEENMLRTLLSRAVRLRMEPYMTRELWKLCRDNTISSIARTPGQVQTLQQMNVPEFVEYCDLLLHKLGTVSGVNAFKSANRLSFKEEQEGYDVALTLNCVQALANKEFCSGKHGPEERERYVKIMLCCCEYYRQLSINGIRKDSTFDMWILEMRKIWQEE